MLLRLQVRARSPSQAQVTQRTAEKLIISVTVGVRINASLMHCFSGKEPLGDDGRDSGEEEHEGDDERLNVQGAAASSQPPGHHDDVDDVDPGCPCVHSGDPNEADNVVRKHYRIKVSGYDPPPPLRSFCQMVTKLGSPSGLLRSLRAAGYEQPTPIQRQAIPVLTAGRELLAVAPTGLK
jgi:hypothetical protein